MSTMHRRCCGIGAAFLLTLSVTACDQTKAPPPVAPAPTAQAPVADRHVPSSPSHDLSVDEKMGGHTLARHVARTDEQLRDRLRAERDISSASTYTDRAAAETVVGSALSSAPRSFDAWQRRK